MLGIQMLPVLKCPVLGPLPLEIFVVNFIFLNLISKISALKFLLPMDINHFCLPLNPGVYPVVVGGILILRTLPNH